MSKLQKQLQLLNNLIEVRRLIVAFGSFHVRLLHAMCFHERSINLPIYNIPDACYVFYFLWKISHLYW